MGVYAGLMPERLYAARYARARRLTMPISALRWARRCICARRSRSSLNHRFCTRVLGENEQRDHVQSMDRPGAGGAHGQVTGYADCACVSTHSRTGFRRARWRCGDSGQHAGVISRGRRFMAEGSHWLSAADGRCGLLRSMSMPRGRPMPEPRAPRSALSPARWPPRQHARIA